MTNPKSISSSVQNVMPPTVKLDEEKSKYAGLAQQTKFHTLGWLVNGAAMLLYTCRKECNIYMI
jgi:hypothetical protein